MTLAIHFRYIQKNLIKWASLCSWDWGPAFPSMGIWKPIRIEAYDSAMMKYVKWNTKLIDDTWTISVEAIFECSTPEYCSGEVRGDLWILMPEVDENPFTWKDIKLERIAGDAASVPVWPDWAIFKFIGKKIVCKSSPKRILDFWAILKTINYCKICCGY